MNAPVPPVESAIRVDSLGLQIGGATILKDVQLDVAAGSFVGVIGPNGAGKTTLFNVISGLVKPTAGRVLMHGEDITTMSVPARARAGLGRTFQTSCTSRGEPTTPSRSPTRSCAPSASTTRRAPWPGTSPTATSASSKSR